MNSQKGSAGIIILIVLGAILGLFALAVIGSAMNLITIPWLKFDSQVQANRDIVTKTYNADNELANYHWFQETAKALEGYQLNIDAGTKAVADFKLMAKGDMSTWSYAETTEYARLNGVLQGNIQIYNQTAKEYDAKANEEDKSMFVNGLPLFFSLKPY